MRLPPCQDWDDAFANMAYLPGSEDLPARWASEARRFRAAHRVEQVAYGDGPRQAFDLILPDSDPAGLAVFVHGGFWQETGKSDWSHLAAGALGRGWAVCLPGYRLAPEARISQITRDVGCAITVAAGRVKGPVRLAGHSAGGHLALRMICAGGPLPESVLDRVEAALSISGLHDLRPLLQARMNAVLRLDEAEALAESPALLRPVRPVPVTCCVGAGERPEFLRQSRLLPLVWAGLDVATRMVELPGENHFSVLDGLSAAHDPLTRLWVGADR